MFSYYLFEVFLVIFLGLLKESIKKKGVSAAYTLVKKHVDLYFSAILLIRVLSKDK
jgi:hypothetical protein